MDNLETLKVEKKGQTTWVWFNRPDRKNALSRKMVEELSQVVTHFRDNPTATRAIVFAAEGNVYCAGADLKERKEMNDDEVKTFLEGLNQLFYQIYELPMPTIAMLQGPALGGGCEISLCMDFRICADHVFFSLPETSLGIIPGAGGTQRLVPLIGLARAKYMIYTAERIPAAQAVEWGLANHATTADQLEPELQSFLDKVLNNAPIGIMKAKQAIQQSLWTSSHMEGLKYENDCYQAVLKTEDRLEALKAFAEKRKPEFLGR